MPDIETDNSDSDADSLASDVGEDNENDWNQWCFQGLSLCSILRHSRPTSLWLNKRFCWLRQLPTLPVCNATYILFLYVLPSSSSSSPKALKSHSPPSAALGRPPSRASSPVPVVFGAEGSSFVVHPRSRVAIRLSVDLWTVLERERARIETLRSKCYYDIITIIYSLIIICRVCYWLSPAPSENKKERKRTPSKIIFDIAGGNWNNRCWMNWRVEYAVIETSSIMRYLRWHREFTGCFY